MYNGSGTADCPLAHRARAHRPPTGHDVIAAADVRPSLAAAMTSWPPSCKCDVLSEIRSRQSMLIYVKNNPDTFRPDPI